MNRRTFLASLIALPAAVKAVADEPERKLFWQFDSTPYYNRPRMKSCITPGYERALAKMDEDSKLTAYLKGFKK